MKAAVDLHIHTALSPCASDDMTPNNIVNMAILKGLDAIAVTDHNSASNCEAVIKCAEGREILVIPGLELETIEEIHLVCLFQTIQQAIYFEQIIRSLMPHIDNREDIFGKQILMDENDNVTGYEKSLLLVASGITTEDAFHWVLQAGGVIIPAHIDRDSYSLLSNFGFIPDYLRLEYLEVSKACSEVFLSKYSSDLSGHKLIISSDAHYLGDILERKTLLELEHLSIEGIFAALKSPISR